MTDATARREARAADATGRCGFCGSADTTVVSRRTRVVHTAECKLVCEHGGRIALRWAGMTEGRS